MNKRIPTRRHIRHRRIRAKVKGTKERPRLAVFRSNQHLYAQLIDDTAGKVVLAVSDVKSKEKKAGMERANTIGQALAKAAAAQGILKVVFDRGGYRYQGQVAALAKAAREGGLVF